MYSHVLKVYFKLWRQIVKAKLNDKFNKYFVAWTYLWDMQYLFHMKFKNFFYLHSWYKCIHSM